MNILTESASRPGRLLASKTPGSHCAPHPSDVALLPPTALAFSKSGNVQGALDAVTHDSDDAHEAVTLELTRQRTGGRQAVNNNNASGKRRRNATKPKSAAAAASDPTAPDDYLPAKSSRGSQRDKEEPTMEHASRHQAAEQRRRNRIKEKLDKLKTRVPHVDPRTNTASFLEAVLRYIDALKARVHELEAATSAPRSSSSILPQPSISSPTQSEHQDWDDEDRHHVRPNGRASPDIGTAGAAATECAYLLPGQARCMLPASVRTAPVTLTSPNLSMLNTASAQPLLLQGHNHNVQMQMLQQQQLQLLLQARLGEMQREQLEQQAASAMLGLHKPAQQQAAADAGDTASLLSNLWPTNGPLAFYMPADMHLQNFGAGIKSPKMLANFNTLDALEMLANQANSTACFMDAAQLGGRRAAAAYTSGSDEDAAPKKRSRN